MSVFCLLGLIATAQSASAEVTLTEFTSKQRYGTFRVGDFVIWQGRIHGDLSPQEVIPGIDKAARNNRGRVTYSARIILIMPAANYSGNGALLVDVPNRGRVYAEARCMPIRIAITRHLRQGRISDRTDNRLTAFR
jgi:hypothetical protein